MPDMNRRQFIVAATTTAAACAASGGCAAPGAISGARPPEWTGPTTFDLGPAADLATDGLDARWAKSGGFFLFRDGGRLYAASGTCTHKACALAPDGRELFCDCHNSHFTPDGRPRSGPARTPLPRFGISVDPAGRVRVDRTKVYPEANWNDPGAFVTA